MTSSIYKFFTYLLYINLNECYNTQPINMYDYINKGPLKTLNRLINIPLDVCKANTTIPGLDVHVNSINVKDLLIIKTNEIDYVRI